MATVYRTHVRTATLFDRFLEAPGPSATGLLGGSMRALPNLSGGQLHLLQRTV
jgi:hypothetical protein